MANREKPLILIIDDNDMKRYSVTRQLTHLNYHILEASTCAEGRVALEKQPDLVILDIKLPDCNGFDFCAEMKSIPLYSTIPVLMISASFVEAQHRAHGLDMGADGYLTTPIDALELNATVKALLRVRETEEQLRASYLKAESANIAKTEFLANMSHEIRTPMNAIIGLGRILAKTPLNDAQKNYIQTLQESADSLLVLINDMLDIAKIEDQGFEFEMRSFSLQKLIDRLMSMMSVKANEKHLELLVIQKNLQCDTVKGDALRIQQILLNLINNALKFTPKGKVTIEVSDGEDESGNHQVQFRIKDTGIGIAQEKLSLIFDKFTQSDSSITRQYGGTGLGLTISRSLTERMGGTIAVNSKIGKGTTFLVTLPLAKGNTEEMILFTAPARASVETVSDQRVLLVEDYPANILVATTLLQQFGYCYDTVPNGIEALSRIREQPYGAILMDIQMHGMDGYETTRQIREWERSNSQPESYIIAMTAHALQGDREKCLDAGMNDYISKPFSPVVLQEKLENAMPMVKN